MIKLIYTNEMAFQDRLWGLGEEDVEIMMELLEGIKGDAIKEGCNECLINITEGEEGAVAEIRTGVNNPGANTAEYMAYNCQELIHLILFELI